MEKIMDIKYKTYKLQQIPRKTITEIKVPDGVVFHLSMGHVMSADEDRDTYNFIAVIPYDENMYKFLLEQKCNCCVYNIFNTYISWIINDSTPENFNTIPFTTEDLNIEPFYIKSLSVNQTKKNMMFDGLIDEIYKRDGKYPSFNETLEITKRCIEESSIVVGYMKITDVSFFGVQAVHIRYVSTSTIDSGIVYQHIGYNQLLNDDNLIATKDEFAIALNSILQDLDILDVL